MVVHPSDAVADNVAVSLASSEQITGKNPCHSTLLPAAGNFPALDLKVHGYPAAFFDGPGGTQVPQTVIDAIGDCLRRSNANLHGQFATSHRADDLADAAQRAGADFFGTPHTDSRSLRSEHDVADVCPQPSHRPQLGARRRSCRYRTRSRCKRVAMGARRGGSRSDSSPGTLRPGDRHAGPRRSRRPAQLQDPPGRGRRGLERLGDHQSDSRNCPTWRTASAPRCSLTRSIGHRTAYPTSLPGTATIVPVRPTSSSGRIWE